MYYFYKWMCTLAYFATYSAANVYQIQCFRLGWFWCMQNAMQSGKVTLSEDFPVIYFILTFTFLFSLDTTCFWSDKKLPGNDVESFRNVEDATECQKLCQINEECFYWTYLKNGRCFLKNANALSTLATKKGPTSGPKICRKFFHK